MICIAGGRYSASTVAVGPMVSDVGLESSDEVEKSFPGIGSSANLRGLIEYVMSVIVLGSSVTSVTY